MGEIKTRFRLEGEEKYRQAMTNAANAVKVLNSEQKLAKAQFKNTGDAEKYAAQQSDILTRKIEQQKQAVAAAEAALKDLANNGVKENDKLFQKWQLNLNSAQTALAQMETELNNVGNSMGGVSGKTSQMVDSLNSINKKMSLDQVLSGINKITGGLEAVAKKAAEVGSAIWDDIKTAAKWADDSATMAEMYEIPLERYLQMEALYASGMDTSTDAILSSMSKMRKNVGKESKETMQYLTELGLVTARTIDTGFGKVEDTQRLLYNSDELFFKAGKALMNMSDAYDKEAAAQAIFGKSWRELIPLFKNYGSLEEYNAALEGMTVNSEDAVTKMAELNDRLGALEKSWNDAKFELLSGLAEPLKGAAEALSTLLKRITEYLKSDEGQEKLKKMGDAVNALFDDLGKIDPDSVVENFASVFNGIVNSFTWIKDNWGDVKTGLLGIAAGFAGLKIASIALNIANLINGFKGLKPTSGGDGTVITTGSQAKEPTTPSTPVVAPSNQTVSFDPKIAQAGATSVLFGEYENVIKKGQTAEQNRMDLINFYNVDMSDAQVKEAVDFLGATTAFDDLEGYAEGLAQIAEEYGTVSDDLSNLEGTAEAAAAALGSVASAAYAFGYVPGMTFRHGAGGMGGATQQTHANGLWSVPFDGYPAVLHKGERVLTAREARTYNANSNLYIENMNMNNGMDAQALAAAMNAQNQRVRAGYGW